MAFILKSIRKNQQERRPQPVLVRSGTTNRNWTAIALFSLIAVLGVSFAIAYLRAMREARSERAFREMLAANNRSLAMQHQALMLKGVGDVSLDPLEQQKRSNDIHQFSILHFLPRDHLPPLDFSRPRFPISFSMTAISSLARDQSREVTFEIVDTNGRYVENLSRKMVACKFGSRHLTNIVLSPTTVVSRDTWIAILHDKSASTKGSAAKIAEASLQAFVRAIPERTRMKLSTFADSVQTMCQWTNDSELLAASVSRTEPNGGTSLCDAMQLAIADLEQCRGDHFLVVFTDGKDSANKISLSELGKRAQASEIKILAIGLRSEDLARDELKDLAEATNGRYLEAETATELIKHFQSLSNAIRQPAYRLTVLHAEPSSEPLLIQVGGAELSVPRELLAE